MKYKASITTSFLFFAFCPVISSAKNPAPAKENKDWVIVSNSYTKLLIDIDETYSPEFGSAEGHASSDTLISVPTLANKEAARKDKMNALVILKDAKSKESNLAVKQDPDILINQTQLGFRQEDFDLNREVSYLNKKVLSTRFTQLHFHDFILSQSILPPALIRGAVMG